jgi:pyroglutamyl-peptidase
MKRVLVTGFEPFNGSKENSSKEVIALLRQADLPGVKTALIRTSYANCYPDLMDAVSQHSPDCVLSLGESQKSGLIQIEQLAVNVADSTVSDNDGVVKLREVIDPDTSDAYFATVPVYELCDEVDSLGIPVVVSRSAGTFVCNYLMYKAVHALRVSWIKYGFVHLPVLPGSVVDLPESPSMEAEKSLKAVRTMVRYLQISLG